MKRPSQSGGYVVRNHKRPKACYPVPKKHHTYKITRDLKQPRLHTKQYQKWLVELLFTVERVLLEVHWFLSLRANHGCENVYF